MYRLTLVKAFNTEELDEYARLVFLGEPTFIEVKVSKLCYMYLTAMGKCKYM